MLHHSVWSSIFTIQISNNHLIAILQNASHYLGISAKEISDMIDIMYFIITFKKFLTNKILLPKATSIGQTLLNITINCLKQTQSIMVDLKCHIHSLPMSYKNGTEIDDTIYLSK